MLPPVNKKAFVRILDESSFRGTTKIPVRRIEKRRRALDPEYNGSNRRGFQTVACSKATFGRTFPETLAASAFSSLGALRPTPLCHRKPLFTFEYSLKRIIVSRTFIPPCDHCQRQRTSSHYL
jgi:hypothetical protein